MGPFTAVKLGLYSFDNPDTLVGVALVTRKPLADEARREAHLAARCGAVLGIPNVAHAALSFAIERPNVFQKGKDGAPNEQGSSAGKQPCGGARPAVPTWATVGDFCAFLYAVCDPDTLEIFYNEGGLPIGEVEDHDRDSPEEKQDARVSSYSVENLTRSCFSLSQHVVFVDWSMFWQSMVQKNMNQQCFYAPPHTGYDDVALKVCV
jgi:hypothetical protein